MKTKFEVVWKPRAGGRTTFRSEVSAESTVSAVEQVCIGNTVAQIISVRDSALASVDPETVSRLVSAVHNRALSEGGRAKD